MGMRDRGYIMFGERVLENLTYVEIGKRHGVTSVRARQVVEHIKRLLRHPVRRAAVYGKG